MTRLPWIMVVSVVWCYWGSVVLMILRSRIKFGASPGAVPSTMRERLMWLFWVPTVIGWNVVPTLAYAAPYSLLRAPQWAFEHPHAAANWIAVIAAVSAYVLTVPCWLTLKSNWSLAIVPAKATELITHGLYKRIRHPIYALGILLLLATIIVAPSPAMLLFGVSHIILVLLIVESEEQFLIQKHGQLYGDYCQRSGRYFPRLWKLSRPT